MWQRRRGADSGTLEYEKLDVNGLGECGKAKKFGKKGWAKGNFLLQTRVAKTCLYQKKAGQKIVSHPGIKPETCRPKSKYLSIALCKEFEHKVV